MFKKILRVFMNNIEWLAKEVRESYEEAYGCEDLAREAQIEINMRKRLNKMKTMEFIKEKLQNKHLRETGLLLTEELLEQEAEEAFQRGIDQGAIDILNNLI